MKLIQSYLIAVILLSSTNAFATSIYDRAQYSNGMTYFELTKKAAEKTLESDDLEFFLAHVKTFHTREMDTSRVNDETDADDKYQAYIRYCNLANLLTLHNFKDQDISSKDLHFAIQVIVREASHSANAMHYKYA